MKDEPALPDRYGAPFARSIARDPWCVFACWEAPRAVAVRLRQIDGPSVMSRAGETGTWYFHNVTPDREYEVDLVDAAGAAIVTSNRVRTPPAGPASLTGLSAAEAEVFRALTTGPRPPSSR